MRNAISGFVFITLLCILPVRNSVCAATYYVSPTGNDAAQGTIQSPWRNMDYASTKMQPGDLLLIRGGTYSYTRQITVQRSGSAGFPLTFRAYSGEIPSFVFELSPPPTFDFLLLLGSYLVIDGLDITNRNDPGESIWIANGAHDVRVARCDIHGSHNNGILISGNSNILEDSRIHDIGNGSQGPAPGSHGIYLEGAQNIIRRNTVYRNWTFGIHVYNGYGNFGGQNLIEDNYVYHNGYGTFSQDPTVPSSGIVIANGHDNNIVQKNILCDNAQFGMYLIDQVSGTQFRDNITCFNRKGGSNFRFPGQNISFTNNISYNDRVYALSLNPGVSSDCNTYFVVANAPKFRWMDEVFDFIHFQQVSEGDVQSRIADPKFVNVPKINFNWRKAETYDFHHAPLPVCTAGL